MPLRMSTAGFEAVEVQGRTKHTFIESFCRGVPLPRWTPVRLNCDVTLVPALCNRLGTAKEICQDTPARFLSVRANVTFNPLASLHNSLTVTLTP